PSSCVHCDFYVYPTLAPSRTSTLSLHDALPIFARDPLSLSGLVVHTARTPQRSIAALTDFLPVVPTTRRAFAPRETVTVYAQVSDRKSTRLNSSHVKISYAVFCLKKKKT